MERIRFCVDVDTQWDFCDPQGALPVAGATANISKAKVTRNPCRLAAYCRCPHAAATLDLARHRKHLNCYANKAAA